MAEEKKPKIDLKARLGKKTVPTKGGGSIPPPVGIPRPGGGIPAPPFGAKAAPRIDASDPYAAVPEAAAVRAGPKAIKVEMSQEVVEEQKKFRSRWLAVAGITAVVGGLVGFASGQAKARSDADTVALSSAANLAKQVDQANAEIEKLADTLKAAKERLGNNQFPDKELADLGAINIPFGGSQVSAEGRGISRFKTDIIVNLLTYASSAEEANDSKEKIQRLLSGTKAQLTDFLSQKTDPKVRWSVAVGNGPGGPWAIVQPLVDAFKVSSKEKIKDKDGKEKNYAWPDTLKVKDGDKTADVKRYTSGDPSGQKLIPVEPTSQGAACPSDVIVKLRREIGDLEDTLRGVKAETAEDEKKGLLETGAELRDQLAKIGTPG